MVRVGIERGKEEREGEGEEGRGVEYLIYGKDARASCHARSDRVICNDGCECISSSCS